MAQLEDLGEVISTDVLVVGGGFAGLPAAIKAREQGVEVLVVDRATIGWAGQATKAGNGLFAMGPDDDIDKFVEFHVRVSGEYLNDQDLLYAYTLENAKVLEELVSWGVNITKDKDGKIGTFKHPSGLWSNTGIELNAVQNLRKYAMKAGIKFLNKVQVPGLLKQGDRVTGAVGFSLVDGHSYIFKAKAVILASSGCFFRTAGMFTAHGDGVAAAYYAGAEMRNAEFCSGCDVVDIHTGAPVYGGHLSIVNALGENISMKYAPTAHEVTFPLVLGMEKEVLEGRGPLYADISHPDAMRIMVSGEGGDEGPGIMNGMARLFPDKLEWLKQFAEKGRKLGLVPSTKPEVTVHSVMQATPVRVDHEMKTTVPGLWAPGSISLNGSTYMGWVRGDGLGQALRSGIRGGVSAGLSASKSGPVEVDYNEAKRLKEEMFAPMNRDKGLSPGDIFSALREVTVPIKYIIRKSKNHMEEALSRIKELQGKAPDLRATDGHTLAKCIEAKSMLVCAEMCFQASLMRTESRGKVWAHYREDFPERDDKNWLKWIIVKNQDGKMTFSTEPVPIDKYKFKPF